MSLQGTIAGFQQYPPDASVDAGLKEHFGRFVYDTVVRVETDYIHGKRDLHAKHRAILARRGEPSPCLRSPIQFFQRRVPLR